MVDINKKLDELLIDAYDCYKENVLFTITITTINQEINRVVKTFEDDKPKRLEKIKQENLIQMKTEDFNKLSTCLMNLISLQESSILKKQSVIENNFEKAAHLRMKERDLMDIIKEDKESYEYIKNLFPSVESIIGFKI
jgi:site-specific recombinase XerD